MDCHALGKIQSLDALQERLRHVREVRARSDVRRDVHDLLAVFASDDQRCRRPIEMCHVAEPDDVAVCILRAERNVEKRRERILVGQRVLDEDLGQPVLGRLDLSGHVASEGGLAGGALERGPS